jgi:uncharacterized LabA/DUF88 family protein
MRTIVYVDGFNLYFRLLVNRPALKWLDVKKLAEALLSPTNTVAGVKYYTARVSGRFDPLAPARQQVYLDALRTVPEISIHMGTFLSSEKFAELVKPPEFRPRIPPLPQPWPDVVKVVKVEEKGSDVNLASHLLFDAFKGNFDVAAVLSNDSDLVEPIRIVTKEIGKPVGLLSPVPNPTSVLGQVASFVRRISVSDVGASQFPDPVTGSEGTSFYKPSSWV